MAVFNAPVIGGAAVDYTIDQSLRFNDNDSAYLSRVPASAGNRKTWTWSGWVKRGNISYNYAPLFQSYVNDSNRFNAIITSGDIIEFQSKVAGSNIFVATTTPVFRDTAQWSHITVSADLQSATAAADRFIVYVNGERIALSLSTFTDHDTMINAANVHYIGKYVFTTYLDGYLAEVNFVDGQALTPSSFGGTDATYGHWKPKKYTGTYGTNGFYLDFADSADLGNDVSGEGNDWTTNNLAATDQMLDSPTNNFATLNPLDEDDDNSITYSEGNLKITASGGSFKQSRATFAPLSSGKWYFEMIPSNLHSSQNCSCGVISESYIPGNSSGIHLNSYAWFGNMDNGVKFHYYDASSHGIIYGVNAGSTDVWGMALDLDSGTKTLKFYINNSLKHTANLSGNEFQVFTELQWTDARIIMNFGQDSSFAGNKTAQSNADDNGYGDFYYSPPTGYLALCTQNLDDPADGLYADSVNPNIDMVLWTGDGATSRVISANTIDAGVDFAWIKSRSHAQGYIVGDVVRGDNKALSTNSTASEDTGTNIIQSIGDASSFTVGNAGRTNTSGYTYIAWLWKMGGTGSSNTDGSITSTVSANVAAGQSIVSYTGNGTSGATVGHGLSSKPEAWFIKGRDNTDHWFSYNKALGIDSHIYLNGTSAKITSADDPWNSTEPTTSVISLKTNGGINGSGQGYIMYAFHSVDGYSKVGSYTGNGSSSDGTFVYTGFRPAYVMVKKTSASDHWWITDSKRDVDNVVERWVYASSSGAEVNTTWDAFDYLSNGFKLRNTDGGLNGSGHTYIYIAFAEYPFKYTNAR